MPKRKASGFDVDRLGAWYTPSKSQKRNAVDNVTRIMAPRSSVTGSEARDKLMAKTLGAGPKVGHRLFSRKRPFQPRRRSRGGYLDPELVKSSRLQGLRANVLVPVMKPGVEIPGGAQISHMDGYVRGPNGKWIPDLGLGNGRKMKWDEKKWGVDTAEPDFFDDFVKGFKKGFNGVKSIAQMIPGPIGEAASYLPSIGDDNPEEGDGMSRVGRLMRSETRVPNARGTGVHHSVPDIKLDPHLRDAVAMVTGNTPLDHYSSNGLDNLKHHHINHVKNFKNKKLGGLTLRRKLTKGGRTFTTLKNILVTPDAAP